MNPYEVLGVGPKADDAEIKQAWRVKAQHAHPDRNQDDPKAGEKFQQIQTAYEVLSDPERRAKFDNTGSIEGDGEDLRTLALQSIAGLAMQWAEQEIERQGEDPVADIRQKIIGLIAKHKQNRALCEKRIARLERKAKRFRFKRGKNSETNIFASTFEHAIRVSREELVGIKRMERCGEIALEIMADYE